MKQLNEAIDQRAPARSAVHGQFDRAKAGDAKMQEEYKQCRSHEEKKEYRTQWALKKLSVVQTEYQE
eukprot:402084-Pyramimonas_sp.AAC.1